jgi:protein dithiol:quinone oxidoreductase
VQRGFVYAVMAVCLVGAVHGARRVGATVYAALALLFALGDTASAARRVWLQHLPPDQVKLFTGTGKCEVVDWSFLGLSIAEWSLAMRRGKAF